MSISYRRLSLIVAAAAVAVSGNAAAQSTNGGLVNTDTGPSPEAMTADVVLVRPLGFAATLIGAGIFLIGLPAEAITGNFSGPAKTLIGTPAKFTFQRPIGESH